MTAANTNQYLFTFSLLLLTAFIYPGFFPYDVNVLSACFATLVFSLSIMLKQKHRLYIPKAFTIAIAAILLIQGSLYLTHQLLSIPTFLLQLTLYLTASLMFMIGISIHSSMLRPLIHTYLIICSLWSIVGLYVWLGGSDGAPLQFGWITLIMSPVLKLAGPFNQGNIFACLIIFALIFTQWLSWNQERNIYLIASAFFSAILLCTLSRGGWLAYICVALALIYSCKLSPRQLFHHFITPWLCGIALGLLLLHFSQPNSLSDSENILSIQHSAQASLEARVVIWATALGEFLSAPILGVGLGQYAAHSWYAATSAASLLQAIDSTHQLSIPYFNAHNLSLQTLAEGGITLFFIMLWAIYHLLKSTWRLLKKKDIRLCFALAAIAFLLQSQVNVTFTKPIPLLLFALFSGLAMAAPLRRKSWKFQNYKLLSSSLCMVTLAYTAITAPIIISWFKAEQALYTFDLDDANSSKHLASFSSTPRTGTFPTILLTYKVASTGEHQGLLKWAIKPLEMAIHDMPYLGSYQLLFYALSNTGAFERACQIGKILEAQHFSFEGNYTAYHDSCQNRAPSQYHFN